jgi:uncharacterized membrane protein
VEERLMANGCCGNREIGAAEHSPALGILEERFARGEIDKAEFQEKRQIILKSREELTETKKGCC